jgi:DNA-binding NarL/FixJ family response regulator
VERIAVSDLFPELTPCEFNQFELVAQGFTAGEVASKLKIKRTTVRTRNTLIYAKLGIERNHDATKLYLERTASSRV